MHTNTQRIKQQEMIGHDVNIKQNINLCTILPSISTNRTFTYINSNKKAQTMDLVEIPFGRKAIIGLCIDTYDIEEREINTKLKIPLTKIRPIQSVIFPNIINEQTWSFIQKFSQYNITALGKVIELIAPNAAYTKSNQILISIFNLNTKLNVNKLIKAVIKTKITQNKALAVTDYIAEHSNATGEQIVKNISANAALLKKLEEENIITRELQRNHNNINTQIGILFSLQNLNSAQQQAVQESTQNLNSFNVTLLHGVTGSGKTEVYCHIIRKMFDQNKDQNAQVLIMLPEITMTSAMVTTFKDKFKTNIIIWHSGITTKQRQAGIREIWDGRAKIIIGVRSAILLPYKNLKMVVIDEEHDSSYKQDEVPTYNARDMGVLRAKSHNIPVILCSATPSMESYFNSQANKYKLIKLVSRFANNALPSIQIVDMIKEGKTNKLLSKKAINAITQRLKNKEQVMIFLNRRGYSRMIKCSNCNTIYECPNCDNQLVYHKRTDKLQCHYCKHTIITPKLCSACNKNLTPIYTGAIGIERVKEEIEAIMPEAVTEVMSSDTMQNDQQRESVLSNIQNNKTNIILSTQIGAKGYNFKSLTLVVALGVDIDHIEGNMRIFERTYQLLTQVAGRAGRFTQNGEIIIQTKHPSNAVIQSMISGIENHFYTEELQRRKRGNLPPYSKQIAIIVASNKQDKAQQHVIQIYKALIDSISRNNLGKETKILGPIPNNIHRMKKQYRYHILLQHKTHSILRDIITENEKIISSKGKDIIAKIDVDPQNSI